MQSANQRPLFNKVPANPGDINNIYFFAIGLRRYLPDADAILFRQFFFYNGFPEGCYIVYFDADHKILRKSLVIELLQYELTAIPFKTGITARIPADNKP